MNFDASGTDLTASPGNVTGGRHRAGDGVTGCQGDTEYQGHTEYQADGLSAGADDGGRDERRKRVAVGVKRRLAHAAWWVFAHTVSGRFGTLVIGLVLARMMGPREFGAVAVVVVALLAIRSLGQLGVGRTIVAWRGEPGEITPTATTISLVSSAVIYVGCYAAAPVFAEAMNAPAAADVIRVLALSVVISAVAASPAGILQRRSPWAIKVLVDQIDNWVGVIATIALVAAGHGLMSVALGRLAGSAVSTVLSVIFAPQALRVGFRLDAARAVIRTGLPFAFGSVLLFAATNADQIVIGHLLPAADLGLYLLALCIASWPLALCSQPVRDAAPAAFARFRLGSRLTRSAFLSSARLLACLTVPVCILIASSATILIRLTYGPEWAPAAHVLVWLAPLAALRIFYELTQHYLAARGPMRATLKFQSIFLVALVPALFEGVHADGIVGAGIVQVVVCSLFLVPIYLRESARGRTRTRPLAAVVTAAAWIALGVQRNIFPDERLALAAAAVVALAIMVLLIYRMRAVLSAVRGAASRAGPSRAALASARAPVFAPPLYPVLTLVPAAAPPLAPDTTADPGRSELESLGSKVRSGARWSALNTVVLRIANFATGVLLARTVFGPGAFGLYAVSQVVLAVLLSANEMGVSLAIVRWDDDVRTFARTVFTLAVASSTLFYCGLFAVAPYAARLLGSPHATGMIRLLSLCVIVDGLACVPLALLTRTFAQRRLMLVNSLNFVVGTSVTLWLALSGLGPISFAWGSVAGCTTALVAAMIAAPFVVLPGWNTSQARSLLRFGLPLAGASLLMLGVFNVDSGIVGGTLGPAALGLYALAFNISSWPSRSISEAVSRVSFAGFSRVAHSAELLAETFVRTLGLLMACTVPASVLLATLAEPLIHLVYGQRWVSAAPVLTLLAILGLLRVAYEFSYDCLAAAGKRPSLLGVQGWWLATLIPVLFIGAHLYGIVGVGAGHVLVAGLLVCPAFLWALSRCGIKVRSILTACWRPFLGGIFMTVACELVLHFAGDGLAALVAASVAGLAVYLPVVYPMRHLLRRAEPSPEVLDEARAA